MQTLSDKTGRHIVKRVTQRYRRQLARREDAVVRTSPGLVVMAWKGVM